MKSSSLSSLLSLALAAPVFSVPPEAVDDLGPASCSKHKLPQEDMAKYHGDDVCDREHFNAYKNSIDRHGKYQRYKKTNEMNRVPVEKTVHCPLQVENLVPNRHLHSSGFDTVWIVENTSREPVVLSFVKEDGFEYSAIDPFITPPQSDPNAILPPGEWRSIHAWGGHLFHARTYDSTSGLLGPVVMQHRLGMIPVGAVPDASSADSSQSDGDRQRPELKKKVPTQKPIRFRKTRPATAQPPRYPGNVLKSNANKHSNILRVAVEQAMEAKQPPREPENDQLCNTMFMGFKNVAGQPLNAYFVRNPNNATACKEQFRFHMGTNRQPDDFMYQWDSHIRFEASIVGHSFAFRSATDPSVLVDTVTLQPTRIVDCPTLKLKAQVNDATRVEGQLQVAHPLSSEDGIEYKRAQLEASLRLDPEIIATLLNETISIDAAGTAENRRPLHGDTTRSSARVTS